MTHSSDKPHTHDLGFSHDLPRMIGRRRFVAALGGLGIASTTGLPAVALECVALPWETQGPYPADGSNARAGITINVLTESGIIREDIRPSFGALTQSTPGARLDFELTLINADGCSSLADHAIYVWHCDATGLYSLYDVADANWLRGVGISNDEGKVRFTTIFPGCYDGRWPHVHFEVFESIDKAVAGEASVLTAQFAFREEDCAGVYESNAAYTNGIRNLGRISLASDNVFADNSAEQIAQQTMPVTGTPDAGYQGATTIPIDFNADRTVSMRPPGGGGFFNRLFGSNPPPPPNN
jgi:protocatechuate 3,4-dioxygenase beta subunit